MAQTASPPTTGRIDLHSHLLPGLDDGCRSLSEAIECVAALKQRRFVATVCTPHMFPEMFPDNTPHRVHEDVARLREQFAEHRVNYLIIPGGELRLSGDALEWVQDHGVPTIGESHYVLTDHWGDHWPDHADALLQWLIDQGYRPILAHPERMDFDDQLLQDVLAHLNAMGVLVQGNFNSLSGGEGRQAARRSLRLLREDNYHLLAMDMHRPDSLPGRFEGLARAEIEVGPDYLEELVTTRPRRILEDALL
jgi:protein-tyrosine phosphatase